MNKSSKKHLGQDVDGDGVIDLGRIPIGTYIFKKGTSKTYGNILMPTAPIRLERDSNHDGVFDAKDIVKKSLEKNQYASDTYFHKGGGKNFTGSAGCQTLVAHEFTKFWKSLGQQSTFHYVLIRMSY